jgi:hypothetical protein
MKHMKVSEIVDHMERRMINECVAREMKEVCVIQDFLKRFLKPTNSKRIYSK